MEWSGVIGLFKTVQERFMQAAKISRSDGPMPVESSVGSTLLSLYKPDGACRFSGRHFKNTGNGIFSQPVMVPVSYSFNTINTNSSSYHNKCSSLIFSYPNTF